MSGLVGFPSIWVSTRRPSAYLDGFSLILAGDVIAETFVG